MRLKRQTFMRALAITGALAALAACDLDKVLQVQPANLIPAVDLEKPENAGLLLAGAAADFDCAVNSYIVVGALIGEELEDALQTADRWPYDQRNVTANLARYAGNSCTALGIYTPLQAARVSANNIRRLMEGWTDVQVPNRQLMIARAAAYEGWAQLLLSESFCEMVFSHVAGENVNWGTRITPDQARDSAIARFDQAIAAATAVGGTVADSIRYFALIGRAKTYQDDGNMAAARADAALVPLAFEWRITNSNTNTRRQNRVFQESNPAVTQQSSSVGAYYRTLGDPRVPVQNMARNSSGTNVPQWAQLKYTAVNSPIPIATGTEMRLLIAEADIGNGAGTTAATIAAMRTAGNQPAYTGTTDAEARAEIIDQRRRALWLTGTHLGDLIRYNMTLSPAAGAATPWGQTFGPSNGSALCLPLPVLEVQNNPLLN
ncbi:MAG TPA: hypothetical protein VEB19_04015 [Gemmatimonadaceae bacterium]|nr:hypothetical protein [Gemmatimonadaceae bacterium]